MAPKRSYKKRSYKKRRTIRKLKTTLRRKIQRGGGVVQNEEMLIRLILNIIPKLIPIILSNLSTFTSILKILIKLYNPAALLLVGGNKSINTQKQRGGGLNLKDILIEKLTTLKSSFPQQDECIQKLINKINTNTESIQDNSFISSENLSNDKTKLEQEVIQEVEQEVEQEVKQEVGQELEQKVEQEVGQEVEQEVGQETAKSSSDNKGIFQKLNIDNIINKVKNIIIRSVEKIKDKLKNKTELLFNELNLDIFDQNDIGCIKMLKDAVLADIKTKANNYFSTEIIKEIIKDIKNYMTENVTQSLSTAVNDVKGTVNNVTQSLPTDAAFTEFKGSLGSKVDMLKGSLGSKVDMLKGRLGSTVDRFKRLG